jgi:hypothetical protein
LAIWAAHTNGVADASPNVTLASSLNPSSYGRTVKLTANVTYPGVPRAQITGSVTFADGTAVLGTATVSSGIATYSTRKLGGGAHPIAATYAPPSGQQVTSDILSQQVDLGASATAIRSTNLAVLNGKPGSIKAKVTAVAPAFGVPTGTVDFYLDPYDPVTSNPYWSFVPLDATGTALFDFSYLYGPGTYTVTAVYSGDANFAASVSPVLVQTVLVNAPTAGVAYSPATVAVGGTTTLTVSATNPTPYAMPSVALGVIPSGGAVAVVSQPAGGSCRAARVTSSTVYYCSLSLAAGATKSLVLKLTAAVPAGTYSSSSYARNIDSGDETSATAILTVQ